MIHPAEPAILGAGMCLAILLAIGCSLLAEAWWLVPATWLVCARMLGALVLGAGYGR